ncbi:MAG: N-methyl-L-tryptophan oxidase [Actinomycetota bacterium]|nr:N-methyl-L-tryptophan oxidase [Actinomycetota bacterium]
MPYDVIVVGLGGMGSAAARALAGRGARVLGLEQFGPAHALGASHGGSRIIRLAYFEHPSYVPLLRSAYDLWDRLEQDSGRALLTPSGGLFMGGGDSEIFAGTLRAAREHGLAHDVLDGAEIRRRYPVFAADDATMAVYEDIAGVLIPEAAVEAHLDLAARAGADLRFHTPVLSWAAGDDRVTVTTAEGTHRAAALVLTPGAWAPGLLRLPELSLRVERRLQLWFAPGGAYDAFAAVPLWMWERPDGLQFYGLPLRDGLVKVALHNRGGVCDPDTVDRVVGEHEVAEVREVLRPTVPALAGDLVRASVCTYTRSADDHFVVAAHSAHPQVAIACGFSGHGFKFAPVIGEALADLVLTGSSEHPIGLFDPVRFSPGI